MAAKKKSIKSSTARSTAKPVGKAKLAPKNDRFDLKNFFEGEKRADGWSNIITGMGKRAKDARTHQDITWYRMTEYDIENLYAGDAMAAKIADMPIEEALQKGYKILGVPQGKEQALADKLKAIKFDEKILDAGFKFKFTGLDDALTDLYKK